MATGTVRVGTSGWSYDHWDGTFYPDEVPRSRWDEYYRAAFPAVEVNYSFYRLPRETTIERWHDRAPPGFRYAVKGSRYITHILRLDDAAEAVGTFVRRVAPLKTYLAAVLWQLPPTLHRDLELLDRFTALLPRRLGHRRVRHAIEFRHPSWVDDAVFDLLRRRGTSHVWVSSEAMPADRTRTSDLIYLRLHGLEGGFEHDYADAELRPWVEAVRDAAAAGCDALVMFNNDGHAHAPTNARRFVELLGDVAYAWGEDAGGR